MSHKLVFALEGLPTEKGDVKLRDFINIIGLLQSIAQKFDRGLSIDGKDTFYYKLVGLSYNSPPTVAVEPMRVRNQVPINDMAIKSSIAVFNEISRGEILTEIDSYILADIKSIVGQVKKRKASIRIEYEDEIQVISPSHEESLGKILSKEEMYPGNIRGVLEYINIHNKKRIFKIYSPVEPRQVKCIFGDDLFAMAISAIGRYLEVSGLLHYNIFSKYPHLIDANDIIIFPQDEELPTISSLRGISPDLTSGLSCEDFQYKIRVQND
jgi:hypothetical protein